MCQKHLYRVNKGPNKVLVTGSVGRTYVQSGPLACRWCVYILFVTVILSFLQLIRCIIWFCFKYRYVLSYHSYTPVCVIPWNDVKDCSVLISIKLHQKGKRADYVLINIGWIKMLTKTKLLSPTNEKCQLPLWDYFTSGYFLSWLKGNRHIRAYNMRRGAHLMSHERQISCPFKTPKLHFHSIISNSEFPKRAAADRPTRRCRAADVNFGLPRRTRW